MPRWRNPGYEQRWRDPAVRLWIRRGQTRWRNPGYEQRWRDPAVVFGYAVARLGVASPRRREMVAVSPPHPCGCRRAACVSVVSYLLFLPRRGVLLDFPRHLMVQGLVKNVLSCVM
jgi:hypothetical protein